MERTVPFLNGCISLVAFIVALTLIIYMLIAFVAGLFDISMAISETIFMSSSERQSIFAALNGDFLYVMAFLIVLMKAHSILTEYMRRQVVEVKQVVELVIVAAVLELVFNSSAYSDHMQVVLAATAAAFFAVYALRYHARALIEKMAPLPTEDVVMPPPKAKVERVLRQPAPKVEKEEKVVKPVRRVRKIATR